MGDTKGGSGGEKSTSGRNELGESEWLDKKRCSYAKVGFVKRRKIKGLRRELCSRSLRRKGPESKSLHIALLHQGMSVKF